MISTQISPEQIRKITKKIDEKVLGMKELGSSQSLTQIAQAAFTITGTEFKRSIARYAKTSEGKKRVQHVYEWNKSGIQKEALFVLVRKYSNGGNLVVDTKFLKSRAAVPINRRLLKPGPTGKFVKARNIFRDKASIIESGKPIRITAGKKTMVFPKGDGTLMFIKKGQSVSIRYPGGKAAKNGYTKYSQEWFRRNFNKTLRTSGLFENLEKSVKKVLNSQNGKASDVKNVVKSVCQKYSKGLTVIKP